MALSLSTHYFQIEKPVCNKCKAVSRVEVENIGSQDVLWLDIAVHQSGNYDI